MMDTHDLDKYQNSKQNNNSLVLEFDKNNLLYRKERSTVALMSKHTDMSDHRAMLGCDDDCS